jgi:hypothetical protein
MIIKLQNNETTSFLEPNDFNFLANLIVQEDND